MHPGCLEGDSAAAAAAAVAAAAAAAVPYPRYDYKCGCRGLEALRNEANTPFRGRTAGHSTHRQLSGACGLIRVRRSGLAPTTRQVNTVAGACSRGTHRCICLDNNGLLVPTLNNWTPITANMNCRRQVTNTMLPMVFTATITHWTTC